MPPPGPPPRVPKLPVAQLLQKLPAEPARDKDAYNTPSKAGDKGGLPMEICAFAQTMYTMPQIHDNKPNPAMGLQPGWGGQNR